MGDILTQAVEILGHNEFTALFDKGYHTGSEFQTAEKLDVDVLVAVPDLPSSSMAPDHAYNISEFTYNKETDTYTCPQGNTLKSNGKWYSKSRNHKGRRYCTKKVCKVREIMKFVLPNKFYKIWTLHKSKLRKF